MKKTRKILVSLGTTTAVIAPLATVISCGSSNALKHYNLLPTYTGQADQLLALGIGADYYPLQLNEKNPYGYITNPGKFMVKQSDGFKREFAKKINQLMPSEKGTGWWNQDALNSDEMGSDPSYWQAREGGVLLYEHYLLDDDRKIIDDSKAPKHEAAATIQTNFRSSRDPYTRIPKGVFFGWDLNDADLKTLSEGSSNKDQTINGETVAVTPDDAKIIIALKAKRQQFLDGIKSGHDTSDWLYNDWYFVDSYHRMFLDNKDFQDSNFKNWIIDSSTDSPFVTAADKMSGAEAALKALFDASTFQADEIKGGIGPHSTTTTHSHHPIYEQQEGEIGAAPMFEGAMRDNQLYLFNVAWQFSNLINHGTPYGQQHYKAMPATISSDKRDNTLKMAQSKEEANKVKAYMKTALTEKQWKAGKDAFNRANKITGELKERMAKLKTYFGKLGANGKVFGLMTIAPGHGVSTIQTMSKYSFLYKELGFAQPLPTNLGDLKIAADKFTTGWGTNANGENSLLTEGKVNTANIAVGENALFNMDDNGWFWNVGNTGHLKAESLEKFKNQFDYGFLATRDVNFNAEVEKNSDIKTSVKKLWKGQLTNLDDVKVNYDVWNEGLKTPFVMHMLLDQIQKQVEDKWLAANSGKHLPDDHGASSWGSYFNSDFLNQ